MTHGVFMTLFDQIKAIAEERAEATKDSKFALMSAKLYSEADTETDKDILENDSQKGDVFVWAMRGNGCGTDLTRFGSTHFETFVEQSPEGSEFYVLQCTGINEGTVKKITREKALNLADMGYRFDENRQPRRERLFPQMDKMLGFDGENQSLRHTVMGSEFSTENGDRSALRIEKQGHDRVAITVVRTKKYDYRGKPEKPSKPEATYYCPVTSLGTIDLSKPNYFAVESQRSGYAKLTEIDKKTFNRALKNVQKTQESENAL